MTGIAELLRGVGSQPSETPPPLWDVPGVEPDFDVIVVGGGVAGAVGFNFDADIGCVEESLAPV